VKVGGEISLTAKKKAIKYENFNIINN
jgi:hypothetical protein